MKTLSFGSALKDMRKNLGLSQLGLAERLGTTQRHLSFLETGRSRATPEFLQRLCTGLNLSASQISALFEASGFRNPFPERPLASEEIADALDKIERRILGNWPFPAFALDQNWSIIRANPAAETLLAAFGFASPDINLADLVLSDGFRGALVNWDEASVGMYFRLQRGAESNTTLRAKFESAKASGLFDHIPGQLTGGPAVPPLSPVIMTAPDGTQLTLSPFVGHLASIQDVMLEGVEVEFMVPLDDQTEAFLGALDCG